jgi:transmembrane sensor
MENITDKNRDLLKRYLENDCTPQEWEQVLKLLAEDDSMRLLLSELKAAYDASQPGLHLSEEKAGRIKAALMQQISPSPVVGIGRNWWKVAAAVFILAISAAALYLLLAKNNRPSGTLAGTTQQNKRPAQDLPPGTNKAVLILGDGSSIDLNDAKNGRLAAQGNSTVIKQDGRLGYRNEGSSVSETVYNTLATPRGGQYELTLPDGTRVWLNAASSIKFPTAFTGKERRVEMTGEAYFEVVHNASQPFIVSVQDAEVRVLGTHFNVMSYNDESSVKTTLLEGSVEFRYEQAKALLQPGQQSQLTPEGKLRTVKDVETDKVIAWKKGYFDFDGDDLGTILRQLSRWYDVKLDDQEYPEELFYGSIPRNMNLNAVLKALEMTGKVRFELRDSIIHVIK